jgi:hypothetical protein
MDVIIYLRANICLSKICIDSSSIDAYLKVFLGENSLPGTSRGKA